MKGVPDTNVLISGLMLPDNIPGKIVTARRNAHFDMVLSAPCWRRSPAACSGRHTATHEIRTCGVPVSLLRNKTSAFRVCSRHVKSNGTKDREDNHAD